MTNQPGYLRPDAVGINERVGFSNSDAVEENKRLDLPTSEEPTEINDLRPPLGRSSVEEFHRQTGADDLRDDLKAETGYSTYAEYLEAYNAKRPYLEGILPWFIPTGHNRYTAGKSKFTVLDLSHNENSQSRVVTRCESISATSIVRTVRHPPANVDVQIVLWNAAGYLDPDVANVLGLGLKIDPRFFGALYGRSRRFLDPKHVVIGGAVATVVRHYNSDRPDAIPIVLIARSQWHAQLADTVEEDIGDALPFQHPAVETDPFYIPQGEKRAYGMGNEPGKHEHPNFTRLFNWCLKNEEESAVGVASLVLKPLIPLLYLSMFWIRDFSERIRCDYDQLRRVGDSVSDFHEAERLILTSGLPRDRLRLRAMVEDSEDSFDYFLRYTRSQKMADLLLTKSWLKVEDDLKRTHYEALDWKHKFVIIYSFELEN